MDEFALAAKVWFGLVLFDLSASVTRRYHSTGEVLGELIDAYNSRDRPGENIIVSPL